MVFIKLYALKCFEHTLYQGRSHLVASHFAFEPNKSSNQSS